MIFPGQRGELGSQPACGFVALGLCEARVSTDVGDQKSLNAARFHFPRPSHHHSLLRGLSAGDWCISPISIYCWLFARAVADQSHGVGIVYCGAQCPVPGPQDHIESEGKRDVGGVIARQAVAERQTNTI